ncbi:MAG: hypothetical protein AB7L17_05650 [Ilumatobacteraceae bacterium]
MNPLNAVRNRTTRAAVVGFVALGLVALPACGGDDDDTPTDSIIDSIPDSMPSVTTGMPTDTTMAPGGTTGGSMGTETSMGAVTSMVDSTTAP